MIKKVTILIIVFALTLFTANVAFADGKQPPAPTSKKGNFKKGNNFKKQNAWNNNGKTTSIPGAPDPTGANGGYNAPTPFSWGIAILVIGSIIYFIKREQDEQTELI